MSSDPKLSETEADLSAEAEPTVETPSDNPAPGQSTLAGEDIGGAAHTVRVGSLG
jgi:hypothetical protein